MSLSITQLVTAVGDENIEYQGIHQNFDEAKVRGSLGQITFNTAPDKVMDLLQENESQWVGMVIWMPRKLIPPL